MKLKHTVKTGQIYVHAKRGTRYIVTALPRVQDSKRTSREGATAVVYMSLDDGQLWTRDLAEFSDGRFQLEPSHLTGKVPKGRGRPLKTKKK